MFTIDEKTNKIIENPDLNKGTLIEKSVDVFYKYVLEKEAIFKEIIVAEYPETGGKDIAIEEISPEVGHWEMLDSDGNVLPYPIEFNTECLSKNNITSDSIDFRIYHEYTEEELLENERLKEAHEKEALLQEQIRTTPSRIDNLENTQDDVILLLADLVGGAL